MPLIINRHIQHQDTWQFIDAEDFQPELVTTANNQALVIPVEKLADVAPETLEQLGETNQLAASLTTEQDHDLLLPYLDKLALIAIEFLVFRDGRGFSQARLLRRAGFKGELRAVGDIARDRLAHLESCGFNAFVIPEERFKAEDLAAFAEVGVSYQQPSIWQQKEKLEAENGIA
ncbi:DUF934 domain-containing protein [Marinospirillum insulare]|uniref:DUF934 domain-containing protein n=1 Tax=Marinospirillum insulare TaxID=217169 RepID=A0ABQ6A1Z3_9GAMM|nr:DUF934 domain-containing protein [Marinospirillum insulare]GLR65322.1 hypothetical protein GCM10007878_27610 [Marinospirillum insulare]